MESVAEGDAKQTWTTYLRCTKREPDISVRRGYLEKKGEDCGRENRECCDGSCCPATDVLVIHLLLRGLISTEKLKKDEISTHGLSPDKMLARSTIQISPAPELQ